MCRCPTPSRSRTSPIRTSRRSCTPRSPPSGSTTRRPVAPLMADIVMPRLSDTMEEGTILRWLKRDGEEVRRGEELVEIETDKATMTYESDLRRRPSDRRRRGRHARGRRADRARRSEPPARPRAGAACARRLRRRAADGRREAAAAPAQALAQAGPAGRRRRWRTAGERVKASPLARRIARESGVDLHALTGSGPGGRIVKADVRGRRSARAGPPRRRARREARPPSPAAVEARGDGQGRDHHGRAHAHAADDRPQDGRVEGHDPRLHAAGRGRHGGVREAAR